MSYKIMSFNIKEFGYNSVKNNKKDIDKIAKIIRDNSPDIIAIQEILQPEALKKLIEELSQQYCFKKTVNELNNIHACSCRTSQICGYETKHWEGRWAKPISKYGNTITEGYAFIWNKKRIELVKNSKGESFEPRIETFTKKSALARPPFIGRFSPKNSRYEFRLINTHIIFSKPSVMKDENSKYYNETIEESQLREKELKTLIDTVYDSWDNKFYDINNIDKQPRPLSPYTFLLGDYNLTKQQCDSINFNNPNIITINQNKTTLKGKQDKSTSLNDDTALSKSYDHFSYNNQKLESKNVHQPYIEVCLNAINLYKHDEDGDSKYDKYRDNISDHLPILLTFDIKKPCAISNNSINSFATFSNNIFEHFKENHNE